MALLSFPAFLYDLNILKANLVCHVWYDKNDTTTVTILESFNFHLLLDNISFLTNIAKCLTYNIETCPICNAFTTHYLGVKESGIKSYIELPSSFNVYLHTFLWMYHRDTLNLFNLSCIYSMETSGIFDKNLSNCDHIVYFYHIYR